MGDQRLVAEVEHGGGDLEPVVFEPALERDVVVKVAELDGQHAAVPQEAHRPLQLLRQDRGAHVTDEDQDVACVVGGAARGLARALDPLEIVSAKQRQKVERAGARDADKVVARRSR